MSPAARGGTLRDGVRLVPSPGFDEAVTAEVHAAALEDGATPGLVVTEYVVVAAAQGFDGDGARLTQVIILPNGAPHHIMGLLRDAVIRTDADSLAAYMDD